MKIEQREAIEQLAGIIIGAVETFDVSIAEIEKDSHAVFKRYFDPHIAKNSWADWPYIENNVMAMVRDKLSIGKHEISYQESLTIELEKLTKQIEKLRLENERLKRPVIPGAGPNDALILDRLKSLAKQSRNSFIDGLIAWRESGKNWSTQQRYHAAKMTGITI